MSDVHLDLPESLHRQLEERAHRKGVSLQELIVESLLGVITVPDVAEQRAAFEKILSRYPEDQAEAALQEILAARK
jgi:predicted HicB family RNase H-like nuclease